MSLRSKLFACCFVVSMAGLLPGCDIFNDDRTTGPVIVHLLLSDPDLSGQSLSDPESTIQAAQWQVHSAILHIEDSSVDLLGGQPCAFSDAAATLPVAEGACESGSAINISRDTASWLLTLGPMSMTVRRARPLVLSPVGDFDLDDITNGIDNCPLAFNPSQADSNQDGIGDACTILDPHMGELLDSDADGVPDEADNCVWISNPDQADTAGGVADGIGDACVEQVAQVALAGEQPFILTLGPAELALQNGPAVFLTVDFRSSHALSCDWELAICALDPTRILFCLESNRMQAQAGCAG